MAGGNGAGGGSDEEENELIQELLEKLDGYSEKRTLAFAQLTATLDAAKTTGALGISQFMARCNEIENIRDRFQGYSEAMIEINSQLPREQRVEPSAAVLAFDAVYYEIRATEASIKSRFENKAGGSHNSPEAKLPRINVPNWDGQIKTFPHWFALYNSVVHRGPFSDQVKFTYLLSFLSGPPLELISHLDINEQNYAVAYAALEERYANPRILASYYVNKMLDFKTISSDNLYDLQNFLGVFDTSYKAYLNLNLPDASDYFVFQCALRCLPSTLRTVFERSAEVSTEFPTFNQLIRFIRSQCRIKELNSFNNSPSSSRVNKPNQNKGTSRTSTTLLVTPSNDSNDSNVASDESNTTNASTPKVKRKVCPLDSGEHLLAKCPKYLGLSPNERYESIKSLRRCFRCLNPHSRANCRLSVVCATCNSPRHHTTLHNDNVATQEQTNKKQGAPNTTTNDIKTVKPDPVSNANPSTSQQNSANGQVQTAKTLFTTPCSNARYVLLGTAQAFMKNKFGVWTPIRLIVDVASQINLISSECVQRLGLPVLPRMTSLAGAMDQIVGASNGIVKCVLSSKKNGGPQWSTEATVVHKVCSDLPSVSLPESVYERFSHLNLADRQFHLRVSIDFLLGAEIYPELFEMGYKIINGNPCALETHFGFIIIGKVPLEPPSPTCQISLLTHEVELDKLIERFWRVEEVEVRSHVDPVQALAERHFVETYQRLDDGRFSLQLPFKPANAAIPFGSSYEIAKQRWLNLEARLRKNSKLSEAYTSFMEEYERLGHMRPATGPGIYYVPHFAIFRDSATSPVRVVFDGSCKDTSNLSLNDRLLTGPPLQQDITEIITHFRLKPISIVTDIKMMYRFIDLQQSDRKFQHILWRKSPDLPLQEYELCTLTYGLSPSPFQAMRCLQALVELEGSQFPLAADALSNSCLMDDIAWSVDDETTALEFKNQLITLLGRAGFQLRKWASNSPAVLQGIPEEHRAKVLNVKPDEDDSLRILGLQWFPNEDVFSYVIKLPFLAKTKRNVSSHIASIFDPMGWLSPVVFWAKSFLQALWAEQYDWDTPLSDDKRSRWAEFAQQLNELSKVKIPRLCIESHLPKIQLVGFCDGSSLGYGAVAFLRCASEDESTVSTHLIKAKTKVAPLQTLTIPRIELLGAVLLSKLINSLQYLVNRLGINQIILFTDATVVLSWLSTSPHLLKTFVANRVSLILDMTKRDMWRHVPTSSNAADCISRGLMPTQLINFSSWWAGPAFLHEPMSSWPSLGNFEPVPQLPEMKSSIDTNVLAVTRAPPAENLNRIIYLTERRSSFGKVRRVVAYTLRFKHNCKTSKTKRTVGKLQKRELRAALKAIVKATQAHYFAKDIQAIKKGRLVSKSLRTLSPYLDHEGLLRVGGRLAQSNLPENAKHPLLLPQKCALSRLLCDYYHKELHHAGPQATQAMIASKYWIIALRPLLRRRIHQCLICHKAKAKMHPPVMADLPSARVTPSTRAFLHASVDFAGPLMIQESLRRNARSYKAYVAVFVCMATKAVHLELVNDLSTPAFRASLDRFIGRRGLCSQLYSDQGTNFKGAARELQEVKEFLLKSEPDLIEYLAQRDIEYCFNSPASPWKGGLWEAAVKSFKNHLMKITLNRSLTYDEMLTFLIRIEAVLNSRPLCPMASTDPESSSSFLTPDHFLIGSALLSPPEHDFSDSNETHLARWQRVQQASQQFWRRWSKEYLNTLIRRKKWNIPREPLKEGDPVFVLQEDTRPLDWPLGRVVQLIPGNDGISRTAIVRTSTKTMTRPIAKLIALPSEEEQLKE